MLFHTEMACHNLMWRGKTWFQCVRGRHTCGKHTLGCLQLISPWSYSLQWMDFASLSMGVRSMRFTNSVCGTLHYGHARRWLKGLGWDLGSSFWEKFWSDLTVCIGFAAFRLFLMVAVSVRGPVQGWTWCFLMPNHSSSVSSQGPGSPEAPCEPSMIHNMVLKVHHKCFNAEGWVFVEKLYGIGPQAGEGPAFSFCAAAGKVTALVGSCPCRN